MTNPIVQGVNESQVIRNVAPVEKYAQRTVDPM